MKRFLNSFYYLLIIHLCGMLGLTLFRLTLFIEGKHTLLENVSYAHSWFQGIAFIKGLWFDNVIGCYILLLPLLIFICSCLFCKNEKRIFAPVTIYFQVMYGIAFMISAANIPYFIYFFKNINSSIYNWFDYGFTTLGMIFGEKDYYLPIFLFLFMTILFVWVTNKTKKYFSKEDKVISQEERRLLNFKKIRLQRVYILIVGLSLTGVCIFGMRGRRGYNPIKVSAAYYCDDCFLNQLGVNPAFNLLASTLDDSRAENKRLHLMDDKTAIRKVQQYLQRQGNAISPICYQFNPDTNVTSKPNVIFVIMESMSASLMRTFGQKLELTPYLDYLFGHSMSFSNYYSAGIHTNNGLYSTFYSFPAIMKRNMMKGSVIPNYTGLPTILHENGYHNMFFMTHESQYDNMNAFFRTNGFDEIYSQENYPRDKVVNSFGVQDDFLYDYALNVINKRAANGKPFMATLLSISNHPPYIIPSYFHPKTKVKETQIVEYADWAIKQFMTRAAKEPWFKNTIFIFEGDHGKLVGQANDEMPISYNHIPLIIYYPKVLKPTVSSQWATQMDIQPTLLHLLGIKCAQNNFGVDLLKERRPFIYYSSDNLIGARSSDHLYVYCKETNQEFLYRIVNNGTKVYKVKYLDSQFCKMKDYLFSTLQTAEHMIQNGQTTTSLLKRIK